MDSNIEIAAPRKERGARNDNEFVIARWVVFTRRSNLLANREIATPRKERGARNDIAF